jgi:hypothetical protein
MNGGPIADAEVQLWRAKLDALLSVDPGPGRRRIPER